MRLAAYLLAAGTSGKRNYITNIIFFLSWRASGLEWARRASREVGEVIGQQRKHPKHGKDRVMESLAWPGPREPTPLPGQGPVSDSFRIWFWDNSLGEKYG